MKTIKISKSKWLFHIDRWAGHLFILPTTQHGVINHNHNDILPASHPFIHSDGLTRTMPGQLMVALNQSEITLICFHINNIKHYPDVCDAVHLSESLADQLQTESHLRLPKLNQIMVNVYGLDIYLSVVWFADYQT